VDTDLRSSLVAALAAALLSALVGTIAGVGFGAIMLRALLGGALFGGLVYGGIFFARRSLPGLDRGEAPSDDGLGQFAEEAVKGRAVDIVLPGEEPGLSPLVDEGADSAEGFVPLGTAAASAAEPPSTSSSAVAEARAEAPRSSPRPAPAPLAEEEPVAEEVGSLLGPEEAETGAAAVPPSAGGGAFEDLDVLPDLDGFTDSFAPTDVHASGSDSPSQSVSMGGSSGRNDSLDPTQLAQAVRTMLKRDQKG
jgi:hypothetical protein